MQPARTAVRRPVWPFAALCLLIGALVGLMYSAFVIDKGVRAYATGESLWSKGRKDAIHALELYLFSGEDKHWLDYQTGLAVPLADRAARLEMDRADFDYERAFSSFVAGRNHPADVPALIRLYRWLGWHERLQRVVEVWVAADVHILELERLGLDIRQRHAAGAIAPEQLRALDAEISRISAAIDPLETEFAMRLGESARWVQDLLDIVIVTAAMIMLLLVVYIFAYFVLLH
ncbi:hypothetical protein AAG565_11285 [Fontimonas sp. SYSU GA230001]